MDTVYIASITEPYESNQLIGVFTSASLAHRAIADWLDTVPVAHNAGGFVTERLLYSTPIPR